MHTYMYNNILKALNKNQICAEKQVLQQLEIYSVISVKSSLSEYKAAIKSINLFSLKLCSFWFWCSFTLNRTSSSQCLEYISSVIVQYQRKFTECIQSLSITYHQFEEKTLPKAQRTRGLSSYHKFHTNLDQTSISESRLSINFKISTKRQHLD